MKTFHISYSFDIKDKRTEEVVFWKRNGFNIEAKNRDEIDTALIKEKIRQMARDACDGHPSWFVSYANYYAITEVKPKKK